MRICMLAAFETYLLGKGPALGKPEARGYPQQHGQRHQPSGGAVRIGFAPKLFFSDGAPELRAACRTLGVARGMPTPGQSPQTMGL